MGKTFMKILVTGAGGTVGGSVARALASTEHETVVLIRDRAKYEAPDGVAVIQGDLTLADDVGKALTGVDRAFLNMADDNGATFAEVAGQVGVGHVVLLSSFSAVTALPRGDHNTVSGRHRAGEQALIAAGVPATFVRCSGFDYNFLMWASDASNGVIRGPMAGRERPGGRRHLATFRSDGPATSSPAPRWWPPHLAGGR
jgi:(4-alkanoyl-5-oxo-2,5-dihydrofuran-3-yl)methyl phosphate reductase